MAGVFDRLRRAGQRNPDGTNPILTGPITHTLLGLSIPMIMASMSVI